MILIINGPKTKGLIPTSDIRKFHKGKAQQAQIMRREIPLMIDST